jgi:hypothetical protein
MTDRNEIEIVQRIPNDFIGSRDFAIRCKVEPRSIHAARKLGRFPISKMKWLEKPGKMNNTLLIHIDQIPIFLETKKEYSVDKKVKTESSFKKDEIANIAEGINDLEEDIKTIETTDLHEARRLNEQIKAKKALLELQRAKNEVIESHKIQALLENISTKTKQNLLSIIPRLSPVLSGEKNIHRIKEILETEIRNALIEISEMDFRK